LKVYLAKYLVARFHSQAEAQNAEDEFNRIFVQKGLPDEVQELRIKPVIQQSLNQLMTVWGMTQTNSEASRLIEGGGVSIDNEKVTNAKAKLDFPAGKSFIIKAGKKKFLKIIVE
jgi:tyrosyl-tRNA synthetase